ncbi:MAG: hypothetical protein ACI9OJ_003035 [Myxococcota bacterium]|jgi:hypothetical protein
MKTARRSSLEGALIGRVLTIVRGEHSLSIPARELPELIDLLKDLAPALAALHHEPPVTFAVAPSARPTTAEVKTPVLTAAAPVAKRPGRARRGRVWEGVKRALAKNKNAPIAFSKLLEMVKAESLTDRNAEHALKIALGKKVRTGELVQIGESYALAGDAAPSPKRTPVVAPAAAPQRRHRPGELWKQMRAMLGQSPDGVTRADLVSAVEKGGWSPARDPEHAVKICLSRVGDQVQERDGRVFLADEAPAVPAVPAASTVRKRKKARADAPEEQAPALVAVPAAPEADEKSVDENDPNFDASSHYPTPRSRLPR